MNEQVSKQKFLEWDEFGIGKMHFLCLSPYFTICTTKFRFFFYALDIGNWVTSLFAKLERFSGGG
jgi:hypothetical protein